MSSFRPRAYMAIAASTAVMVGVAGPALASRSSIHVSWSSPTSGATLSGVVPGSGCQASVSTHNTSVTSVAFSIDGNPLNTDTASPWQCSNSGTSTPSLDTTQFANGSHTFTVVATAKSGQTATASETVNISNGSASAPTGSDTTPPAVAITSPASGATVSGAITVAGTSSDNVGVLRVEVSVDGGGLQNATGTSSWSYGLDTTTLSNGTHTITARATDTSNNFTQASESINVSNGTTTTSPSPSPSPTSSTSSSSGGWTPPSSPPSQQGCSGPITITQGGTYTGCWVSNGQGTAITIATSSPVTITKSTIEGTSQLVASSVSHTNVTITNTGLYGLYPGGSGRWGDYAVYLQGYDRLDFEHNYVLDKGAVNLVDWAGSGSSPVVIRYNYIKNVDGRLTNGSGGYSGTQIICAIQLNNINNAAGIDIGWNYINNVANQSYVVDNISIYQSSGTSSSPLNVHDNYIRGAFPYLATSSSYSGGGIMLGDGGGNYTIAQNNQVVGTTNYGMAISGGQNETITKNTIISSGLLPDGTPLPATNVGTYVWNQYSSPFGNDSDYGNTIGWYRADPNGVYGTGRADSWMPDCNASCSNTAYNGSNVVTLQDESNQDTVWANKVSSAGVVVGPTG